ncbi:MAG: MFS transporter [bacterium]
MAHPTPELAPDNTPQFGRFQRICYAMGNAGVSLLGFTVSTWLQAYYVPPTGGDTVLATAALFGTGLIWGRVIDGLADPISGYWSDITRSPLGRRRPFMLIFGPLAGLCVALLFPRLAAGHHLPFPLFVALLCAYYFAFTLAVTPYLAMLPEVARGAQARMGMTTLMTLFTFIGVAVAMVFGKYIRETTWMCWVLGLLGGFLLMVPALAIKEPPLPPLDPAIGKPSLQGMFRELGLALNNYLFRLYVYSQLCMWFGFNMMLGWLDYGISRLMRSDHVQIGMLAILGSAMVLLPVTFRMVLKLGKVRALGVAMGGFALGFLLLSQVNLLPAPPVDLEKVHANQEAHGIHMTMEKLRERYDPAELTGDPATPNRRFQAGLIILALMGLPLALFFSVPNAILADVIDADAAVRGPGREGMFFAAQAVVIQTGGAASGWTLNRVLTMGGDFATVQGIALAGWVVAGFIVVGMVFLWRFGMLQRAVRERTEALA